MTFLWVQPSNDASVQSFEQVRAVLIAHGFDEDERRRLETRLMSCGVGEWVRITAGGEYGVGVFVRLGAQH